MWATWAAVEAALGLKCHAEKCYAVRCHIVMVSCCEVPHSKVACCEVPHCKVPATLQGALQQVAFSKATPVEHRPGNLCREGALQLVQI